MNEKNISISEAEWQVMKVLWKQAPQTLGQIIEKLNDTDWSNTTIQTYLARLVKKRALSTERQGKGYLYSPNVTEQECQLTESRSFLNKVFGGSVSGMVTNFIKSGDLSQNEINQLKKILEKHEESQHDNH